MEWNSRVLDEKCKCNLGLVGLSHGKFDEEKVFQVWRNVLWVEMENGEVSGKV